MTAKAWMARSDDPQLLTAFWSCDTEAQWDFACQSKTDPNEVIRDESDCRAEADETIFQSYSFSSPELYCGDQPVRAIGWVKLDPDVERVVEIGKKEADESPLECTIKASDWESGDDVYVHWVFGQQAIVLSKGSDVVTYSSPLQMTISCAVKGAAQ